jgi:hypothetical protein
MYSFSRSIYRELSPYVSAERDEDLPGVRRGLLDACESTMRRLALDRRYFARPTKTLFSDVRTHFPISEQLRVYRVIDSHITLAIEYLEQLPDNGYGLDGTPRECHATTRKGSPCQREPLPGRDYCPSHKHLEEAFEELELEELAGAGAAA